MIKITEKINLNEMAFSRTDAIDRCVSLGVKFIEHFHKIYEKPQSESVNHWISAEMQPWLNSVRNITLKPKNKHLLSVQMSEWFLTAGTNYKEIIPNSTDEEIEAYDKFSLLILNGKNVEESLIELNII